MDVWESEWQRKVYTSVAWCMFCLLVFFFLISLRDGLVGGLGLNRRVFSGQYNDVVIFIATSSIAVLEHREAWCLLCFTAFCLLHLAGYFTWPSEWLHVLVCGHSPTFWLKAIGIVCSIAAMEGLKHMIKSCIAAICHATITSMGRFIVLMKTVVSEFRVIAAPIRIACTASFGRLVSALVLIRRDVVRFFVFAVAIFSVGAGSILVQHEMSTCLAWYERQGEKSTIQDIRTLRVLFTPKCSWPETTSRFWREGRTPRILPLVKLLATIILSPMFAYIVFANIVKLPNRLYQFLVLHTFLSLSVASVLLATIILCKDFQLLRHLTVSFNFFVDDF